MKNKQSISKLNEYSLSIEVQLQINGGNNIGGAGINQNPVLAVR